MKLIEDIKRDLESGMPGPWVADADEWGSVYNIHAENWLNEVAQAIEGEADARRIARVPDMEDALLASEELARAAHRAWMTMEQNEAAAALGEAIHKYEKATGKIGPT